jgi:formate/nitrite transporter
MNFLTPAEIAVACGNGGKAKTELPIWKMFILGILAGAYIGFGANLATKIGSAPDAGGAVGLFLFGAVFSVGLMMVVIAGSELFTGNAMACFVACCNGQASWGGLVTNWVVVYAANFVGSVLLVYIIYYSSYWVDPAAATGISAMGIKALGIAKGKLSLTFTEAFLRGILCNWLVCLAVWMAMAAKDIVGKVFAIFFPIMAFVASGFEHSVANMFFIPMGIMIAKGVPVEAAAAATKVAPEAIASFYSYGHFFSANLLPVTLGNIVGGSICVGMIYWLLYLKK